MIDTESGETAPLKPTTGQKTRGLTALVVACAALSFFAGAAATNGLRTVAGPAELRTERVRPFYAAARARRRSRSHVVVVVHARRLRQVRARRLRVLF